MLKEYEDIFKKELGTLKNYRAHIHVKDDIQPKFYKVRSVPYALKQQIEKEFEKQVEEGILEPVELSDCAPPIVLLRLCSSDCAPPLCSSDCAPPIVLLRLCSSDCAPPIVLLRLCYSDCPPIVLLRLCYSDCATPIVPIVNNVYAVIINKRLIKQHSQIITRFRNQRTYSQLFQEVNVFPRLTWHMLTI